MSDAAAVYTYNSLKVTVPSPFVYNVEMDRPKKMNALNKEMWTEIGDVFTKLSLDPDCRVVVLSGAGRMFSSGANTIDISNVILLSGRNMGMI
jgi:delta(3,5)-delta(2,4)-dienoyl-CoA isomerase